MNGINVEGISINNYMSEVNTAKSDAVGNSFEKRLKQAMEDKDEQQLRKVCVDMEKIIINMMYGQMKATIPESNLFEKSISTEIYRSMLDEKLVEEAANNGGIGLADVLYRQLGRKIKVGSG